MKSLVGKIRNILVDLVILLLPIYQKLLVIRLRHKKEINVVFFAMSLSMWRYQHLYEALSKHPKFKVTIVIQPAISYTDIQQEEDKSQLIEYFNSKNIPFMLGTDGDTVLDIKTIWSPDILFYPQPYHGYYPYDLSYGKFWNKLICYAPYAFWMSPGDWSYNLRFHNLAWKMFYPTELHLKDAKKYSFVKGRNMEIVGYPTADDFFTDSHNDIWKPQLCPKKRVIWAPHFTIVSSGYTKQSNFLNIGEDMLDIAQKYNDKIQFVFKPHPRLFSELCKYHGWGEERAKEYYRKWGKMENTQVETGEFVDLFMTSDAMIHDCGSFAVEYHYSGNPVMYIAEDFEAQVASKNDFGKIAMNLHYVGKCKQDIIDFIENVVLAGEDPLKPQRQQFLKDYLIPPHGKTVAENTMDVLLRELC